MLKRRIDALDAPVGDASAGARRARRVGIETQFIAGEIEADVERLIEVGLLLKRRRVPRFGAAQIEYGINDRAESLDHVRHRTRIRNTSQGTTAQAAIHVIA